MTEYHDTYASFSLRSDVGYSGDRISRYICGLVRYKRIEAYVQTRVLGMTFESISMEYRRSLPAVEGQRKPEKGMAWVESPVPRIEITI